MSADLNMNPYLVIGTPCYGRQVADIYAGSLLKLQMACQERGVRMLVHMLGSDALITRARQNIVARFLGNDAASHLLFIDADIGFEPAQVFRLMDFDVPVCGAIYPVKRLDWERVAAYARSGRTPLASGALTYIMPFKEGEQIAVRSGFARVNYAPTGFLMIKREALLSMVQQYSELRYGQEHGPNNDPRESQWRYALFNCMIDAQTGYYLSEDFSFCKRWTDMGGEIWVDLESRLTHVGALNFEGDLTTQFSPVTAAEN